MTSIKEIAALAGVSRGTVDRALNNRGGVNPAVAAQIKKIAKEKGYKSNRAARALAARKKPLKIGAIFPLEGNPFFEDVVNGLRVAEKEYADYGVSISLKVMKRFSPITQLHLIDELLAEGIQVLVLAAINEATIQKRINQLVTNGILVITSNTDLEGSQRLCYVGADYKRSGEIAAGLLGLVAGKKPMSVVILLGAQDVLGHAQRHLGFRENLEQYHPNIEIVGSCETFEDAEVAYQNTLELFARYPDLEAIYISAGGIGGTCRALVDAGKAGEVRLITHDCTSESKPFIEAGVITASILQDPFQQGYLPVKLAYNYFIDNQVPSSERIHTKLDILIRENLEE